MGALQIYHVTLAAQNPHVTWEENQQKNVCAFMKYVQNVHWEASSVKIDVSVWFCLTQFALWVVL